MIYTKIITGRVKLMAYEINDDCIGCAGCESVCPNSAIYQDGEKFAIDKAKCTECKPFFAESQCSLVCPVEAVVKENE